MRLKTVAACMLFGLSVSGCDYLPTDKNKALDAVREVLIDPDSAKFSSVFESAKDFGGFKKVNYCGYVNGKNRMGAYTGKSPFIYEKKYDDEVKVHLATEPLTDRDFRDFLGYMHYDPSKQLMEQWAKIHYGCRFSDDWKSLCGSELPYPEHRLCSSFYDEDIEETLEKEFPR